MVAGGSSWEAWNELRHLKCLGIFWKTPSTGPVLFLWWVSRLFWLHLFSMCWARSTNGLLENSRQGVSSRHWQLPSSAGVQFPTGAMPSSTTKLKVKPWINWLPYIVNTLKKGSSSKEKMSKTLIIFLETESQGVIVHWDVHLPPAKLCCAEKQESFDRTWPGGFRSIAQQEFGYRVTIGWGKGKQFSKTLFLSKPDSQAILKLNFDSSAALGGGGFSVVCNAHYQYVVMHTGCASGHHKKVATGEKKSHNTPIYSLVVWVDWELC